MKKYLKIILKTLILISALTFIYSIILKPYTNEIEFEQRYGELSPEDGAKKYWDLRNEYLTNKYIVQEFALTFLLVSILLFIFINKKEIKSPHSKMTLLFWGFVSSCVYIFWFGSSLWIDLGRGSFPHWADTIIIPFIAAPFLFAILFFIYTVHVLLRYKNYTPSYNLKSLKIRDFKSYFGLVSILNFILIVLNVFVGGLVLTANFIFVLFLIVSLYFNLSLLKNKNKI